MECELANAVTENDKNGDGKKYIVRIMCQNKLLFVEFSEEELNILRFPEKGKQMVLFAVTELIKMIMSFSC